MMFGIIVGFVIFCGFLYCLYPSMIKDIIYLYKVLKIVRLAKKCVRSETWSIDVCEEKARQRSSKTYLHFQGESFSYSCVDEQANRVANLALAEGWKCGDVVAIFVTNEPSYLWTCLGLAKCGIVCSLINTNLRGKALQHCLNIGNARAIIVGKDKDLHTALRDVNATVPIYAHGDDSTSMECGWRPLDKLLKGCSDKSPDRSVRNSLTAQTPMFYIFTSGTTGLPKAAIVTQERATRLVRLVQLCGVTQDDVVYTPLPLYHLAGLFTSLGAFVRGCKVVIRPKFSVKEFWEDCRRYDVTAVNYIGELCRYLVNAPKSDRDKDHKVRLWVGNGLRADIWPEFQSRFGVETIFELYGATEGNAILFNVFNKQGSCGYLSPLLKWMYHIKFLKYDFDTAQPIRNSSGKCIEAKNGEPGLLVCEITAKAKYDGYAGDRALSEKNILRSVSKEGDAYLNSGDLLYRDDEYYVYFSDRLGDTFRWKSENVSTTEVSNVLCELDWIEDANTYGVTVPGCEGRCGMTALILREGHHLTEEKRSELYRHCDANLASYARPRFFRIKSGELRVTPTFKHLKADLVKEGFDETLCDSDELYFLDMERETYSKLETNLYNEIISGQIRL